MIVKFTDEERAQMEAFESKYERLLTECRAEIESLRSDELDPDGSQYKAVEAMRLPCPPLPEPKKFDENGDPVYSRAEMNAYYNSPEYIKYQEANEKANHETTRIYNEWESKGSDAWREARKREIRLMGELAMTRNRFYKECEKRQFAELGGDKARIMENARAQMELMIKNRYEQALERKNNGDTFACCYIRVDGDKFCLDFAELLKDSADLLSLHYDYFKQDPDATAQLHDLVVDILGASPYTGDFGVLGGWINEGTPHETALSLVSMAARRAKRVYYPTDKLNFLAFNLPGKADINGQTRFDGEFKINVGKRGEAPAIVIYNVHFDDDDVSISQKLDPYDKRVQIAAGTLWKEYGEYFTLKQLYHAMGNDSTPGAPSFERMLNSLKKQLGAEIQITNEDEAKKQKRRAKFIYSGPLLPYETITAEVNGKIQDGVIHLFREPPLIEFARQRKQITTIPRAAITVPLSQTNDNLAIEDYIIERINRMKHDPKVSRKILLKSLKDHCQITAKNQRVWGKIETILSYYVKINFIKGYNILTDAFVLEV